ncbi:MAG TPA: hypothetical protein DIS93_12085 [Bdellovibrionales bacterium]|nr:hypothetical protein [Bdellovibrionales bacterium]
MHVLRNLYRGLCSRFLAAYPDLWWRFTETLGHGCKLWTGARDRNSKSKMGRTAQADRRRKGAPHMIHWIFAIVLVSASVFATFSKSIRSSILALWICGLGAGAFYLTIGTELLAIIQWIVATVIAISFVFFAVTFGEYSKTETRPGHRSKLFTVLGILIGVGLPVLLWLGVGPVPEEMLIPATDSNDLSALGLKLVSENFLALEVLGVSLLVAIVGGGVIARPLDSEDERGNP